MSNANDVTKETPSSPKVIMVSPAQTYSNAHGEIIQYEDIHLTARAMSMQKMHKTFPVTGGLCTATAAKLKGTVVYGCCNNPNTDEIIIGHTFHIIQIIYHYYKINFNREKSLLSPSGFSFSSISVIIK